jgi:PAS domain S-box-containing protein
VIREANRAAVGLLGLRPQFLAGKPLLIYVTETSKGRFVNLIHRLRQGEAVRGEELWLRPRNGLPRPVLVHATPAYDPAGRLRGLRWMLHDASEYHAARARALHAERLAAVGQTVTALAHESRNALQCSLACLRMLALEVADRPEALRLIDRVQGAQDRLQRLFDDLRAYGAPVTLKRQPCDLRAAWREAWASLEEARRGRGCQFAETPADGPLPCFADTFCLEQVFRNLFENALAAAADPVRVTVRAEPAEVGGRPAYRVTVADNGPGMNGESARRAFEPFFTTKTRGTGLGLAICRRVVEAHGGTISADGTPGHGTAVTLTVPRGES